MPTFIARRDSSWAGGGEGVGHSPVSRKSGFGESLLMVVREDMSFVSSRVGLCTVASLLWFSFPGFGLG
jgi:hypothetical protein